MIDTIYIHQPKNPDEVEPSGFSWDLPVETALYFFDLWEKEKDAETHDNLLQTL